MKKVLIIDPLLKQYRLRFIEKLYYTLQHENIQLKLLYSDPPPVEMLKSDNVELDKRYGIKTRMSWFMNNRIGNQHVYKEIMASDLIIIEQSYKYIVTYVVLLLGILGIKRTAFWGHGRNRQAQKIGYVEWIKMKTLDLVDWWFAYTKGVSDYLISKGVPLEKITVVQNTVDVEGFTKDVENINNEELSKACERLGISENALIGLYCGGLYPEKHLEFLLEACHLIKREIPDFELLIVGSGQEQEFVEQFARQEKWLHYLGPKFGRDKALYFRMAHLFLNPGLVGLSILDAFAAGLPLITTEIPVHSPEIDYLENNSNGMIAPFETDIFAKTVIDLFGNRELLSRLSKGAAESAKRYSLDKMVRNFKNGIITCLLR